MKEQKGITLVALIITIIVMLILVSVTVSVVINSGLLNEAQDAGKSFANAYENERYTNDHVTINGGELNISEQTNWLEVDFSEKDNT